ncbi:MAG: FecR domain-containing protein [Chlamydiae bacterium]|nr:FecR domain-containing protein [Chlamydiota bacterium]MBI3276403.1 FecR domain-containing protein [Chlamydiota bacterium]
MKKKILAGGFSFFLLWAGFLKADEVARLYSVQGVVEVRRASETNWAQAPTETLLYPQDQVRTGSNSRSGILFKDGILVRLGENSLLELKPVVNSEIQPLKIFSGTAYFFSREPKRFPEIETPVVSAAVRGTEFSIEVKKDKTKVSILKGKVICSNSAGSATAEGGEEITTLEGIIPSKHILIRPLDAVEWALYYPALIDPLEYSKSEVPELMKEVSQFLLVGQVEKAKVLLEQIPIDQKTPALALRYSLESIIALVMNQKEEAFLLAQKAVEVNPNSPSVALAMSYAEQAHFHLEKALQWTQEALKLSPQNGLAHSRLMELYLGFGEIKKASQNIQDALHSSPEDGRVLTVVGFTYLTQYETKEAILYFQKAIAQDPANGLPHLGLGLSFMHQNKVEEARLQMEMAVHLEPNISLYRSYLGKAYFEEKRDTLSSQEYETAKTLDPQDPTPHLYEAFNKLAHTRPIEALWEIEDSIKLNDNRAVYRSRMLLDQDQAVRSAGLSQAFTSVGFSEAARIEAIKSMNRDYSNYSAHLLLAGSYINTPRLGLASISELLITRLLVPLSLNPLDPSIRGEASFNEYASLFDRQRGRIFLDGSVRSADDYISGRVLHSMLTERSSYTLSYFPEYLGGYLENDWARSQSVLFLTQMQPTYSDTLSFESIFGKDDEHNFKFNDLNHRVGFHHRFGPEAHFISQLLYTQRDATSEGTATREFTLNTFRGNSLTASLPDSFLSRQTQDDRFTSLRGDGQFIWDSSWVSLIAGAGAFDSETDNDEIGRAPFDRLGFLDNINLSTSNNLSEQSQRLYTYTTWHLTEKWDAFGAANFTHLELAQSIPPPFVEGTQTVDEVDPKAGLAFYLTPSTTLRAAYFETLGPVGLTDLESIEPTQIAGFNQFVDELPGNKAQSYGMGLDQKFSKRTYFGTEVLHRKVEQSLGFSSSIINVDTSTGNVTAKEGAVEFPHIESSENLLNAYFYQILTSELTGTLDYTFAHFEEDFSLQESQTHRLKIGTNYFHPKGWFVRTAATWRHQDLDGFGSADGIRDFWIWDASIGYQLPKRYGLVILSVTNILDQDFLYESIGLDARFIPERSVNLRVSLNF